MEPLYWRYAVKKFDPDRRLPEEKIGRLKEAFNLTATSYGLQPIRMLVIRHRELQEQLLPCSYGQRQVVDASHLLVICVETHVDRDYISAYFNRIREVRGTPENILDPFRKDLIRRFQTMTSEEIRIWATHQAYLALGNLLTVCAYERIDSCPMEGFDPEAYDRILELGPQGLASVLVLPVGYRAGDDMFSGFRKVRRDISRSVRTITDE